MVVARHHIGIVVRSTVSETVIQKASRSSESLCSSHLAIFPGSVLIPIVMEAEAAPFVEHLGLELVENFFPVHTPFLAFSGVHHKTKVTVITMGKDTVYETGVDNAGTVPSAIATFLALVKDHESNGAVDLVLNAGTCGGFSRKGAEIGDVFLTTGVANHDRRIPIPGFDAYGIGKLETVDPKLMAVRFRGPKLVHKPSSCNSRSMFSLFRPSLVTRLDSVQLEIV